MGHNVTGIIVSESDVKEIASIIPFQYSHSLNQGFVIFPLTDELIDENIPAPMNFSFKEFVYLSQELSSILIEASAKGAVLYCETDYFGGRGSQSAVVYKNGATVYPPKKADSNVINQALEIMGAKVEQDGRDAFQSIGLGDYRSSYDILDSEENG